MEEKSYFSPLCILEIKQVYNAKYNCNPVKCKRAKYAENGF